MKDRYTVGGIYSAQGCGGKAFDLCMSCLSFTYIDFVTKYIRRLSKFLDCMKRQKKKRRVLPVVGKILQSLR